MKVSFTIPGKPMGKQRPRKARGLRGLYTPRQTQDYEAQVRYLATKDVQMYDKPVKVTITAFFPVPKTYSKKRTKDCLEGRELPTKKPDIDNIEKIILDGMNPKYKVNKALHKAVLVQPGVYQDDSQVVSVEKEKIYGEEARVEVTVEDAMKGDNNG